MTAPKLPISKPHLGQAEIDAAAGVIASGWVTQGPKVAAFEAAFARAVASPHACAVSNCTVALHLALLCAGVGAGDVVLTVSSSFIATANAIRYCGAEPYFVDIDPATGNMDPALLAACIADDFVAGDGGLSCRRPFWEGLPESPLTRTADPKGRLAAIMVVHQVGMPCDMAAILAVAKKFGLPVVEDAACAIGSLYRPAPEAPFEPVGKPHGQSACFSFHPRKVLTCGEGGMITSAGAALDARLRLMRQHGMSVKDLERHAATRIVFEDYLETAFNYRLTDIQAAIGLAQLERLEGIVSQRRLLAGVYAALLGDIDEARPPSEPDYAKSNFQSYVVMLDSPARLTPVMQSLLDRGIATRRGIMCSHLEPPYAPAWPRGVLPHSENARDAGLILPLFHQMTGDDCARVAGALKDALAGG